MTVEQPPLWADDIAQVIDYWKAKVSPRARRSRVRPRLVAARIAEGFSPADIRRAVDACYADPWYRARGLTDLVFICRDGPTVERFLAMTNGSPDRRPFDDVWAELMGWVHLHGSWATAEEKRTLSTEAAGLVRWAGGFPEVARWEARQHSAIRSQARRAYEAGVR